MSYKTALEATVGLVPVTAAAGVTLAFTRAAFPEREKSRKKGRKSKNERRSRNVLGFGDFSNVL